MSIIITIPRKVTKGAELVIVPREEYEEYLQLRKIIPVVKMTPAQRRDLEKAREEYKRGEHISLEQFKREMGIVHKRER